MEDDSNRLVAVEWRRLRRAARHKLHFVSMSSAPACRRRTRQHRAKTSHYQRRQASYNEVLLSY
jgi:hypothetical protein